MTPAHLFARRGIAEPIRPRGLCQEHPAYVRGREDFVYGRGWHRAYSNPEWQYIYDCAWQHEMAEVESVRRAYWMGNSTNS